MGMFLVSFVVLVALITVLSGIGVGDHCGVGSGGVYSMISSVLGGQTGGTIGLLYVFGQVSLGGWGREPCPEAIGMWDLFPRLAVIEATIFSSTFPFDLGRGEGGSCPYFIDGQTGAPRGTQRA